jgi:hypothetical protein
MKRILLLSLAGLVSCAGVFSVKPVTPQNVYAYGKEPGLHKNATWGNYIKMLKPGDSVVIIGEIGEYWQAVAGTDTGYVEKDEWGTAAQRDAAIQEQKYAVAIMAHPLEFTVPLSDDQEVWGRAQYFLNKYGDMKVQVATDFMVETYNPISGGDCGYSVNRLPSKTGVTFTVNANYKAASMLEDALSRATQNAHVLAYFMKTGEVRPNFIY